MCSDCRNQLPWLPPNVVVALVLLTFIATNSVRNCSRADRPTDCATQE
jgi:hypothetical protein